MIFFQLFLTSNDVYYTAILWTNINFSIMMYFYLLIANEMFVKSLFNCNNVKIKLTNKLILRKKEIHADQNNLYKWIEFRLCEFRFCQIASSHDNLYFCSAHIWVLNAFKINLKHNHNIIFFFQTSNVRIIDKNLQTVFILFDQSARRLFGSFKCIKFFVFFVDLNTRNDDCRLNFNKNYNVYSNLKCK